MKINLTAVARYFPLLIGLAIIAVGSLFVPWDKVVPYFRSLSLTSILLLLLCSIVYYFGRVYRYWLMVRMLDDPAPFGKVALACLIAQPVSFLPAGELYKSAMLKKYANVSFKNGIPSVFAQALTESIGLLIIALVGAMFLHRYVGLIIFVASMVLFIVGLLKWHSKKRSHRLINKVPKISISRRKINEFLHKNRTLLSTKNFLILVVTSYISTFAGIAAIYIAAKELSAQINLFEAAIAFALPVILQGVSFLPAGLGVNEQGSVAILTLFGQGLAVAVAITILVRLVTIGSGFLFGFMAFGWVRLFGAKEYS